MSVVVKLLISVTLILSAFDSGCWILYLYVCGLTITLKEPGSVLTAGPDALFSIKLPTSSVAVTKRQPNVSPVVLAASS